MDADELSSLLGFEEEYTVAKKEGLKSWTFYLTFEPAVAGKRDTHIYLASPESISDLIDLSKYGIYIDWPEGVVGQEKLNGKFKDSRLCELNPALFMRALSLVVPMRWGTDECMCDSLQYINFRNTQRYNCRSIYGGRCLLELNYSSEGLKGGIDGLRDNLIELIKIGDFGKYLGDQE